MLASPLADAVARAREHAAADGGTPATEAAAHRAPREWPAVRRA